jgi:mannose-6-phosphate isomerase-like protein (cupin superfamily)
MATNKRAPVHVPPGKGRRYPMGPLEAVFLADGAETRGRYSVSEWWLDAYTRGPHIHKHPEDCCFYVLSGTMTFFVDGSWRAAPKGTLVLVPGNAPHTFENRSARRAGALSFQVPGDFEPHMAGIAPWFRERSTADARTENAPVLTRRSPRRAASR